MDAFHVVQERINLALAQDLALLAVQDPFSLILVKKVVSHVPRAVTVMLQRTQMAVSLHVLQGHSMISLEKVI